MNNRNNSPNNPQVIERELKSTVARLARSLRISYDDALAIMQGAKIATLKLPCPMLAAWTLKNVVKRRFGDTVATAAVAGVLIYSCGHADYDTIMRWCAVCGCDTTGVDTKTADTITETAYEVGTTLGLPTEEAWRIAGLLKYHYLNFRAMLYEDDLRGEGVLWGELVAYALRISRPLL